MEKPREDSNSQSSTSEPADKYDLAKSTLIPDFGSPFRYFYKDYRPDGGIKDVGEIYKRLFAPKVCGLSGFFGGALATSYAMPDSGYNMTMGAALGGTLAGALTGVRYTDEHYWAKHRIFDEDNPELDTWNLDQKLKTHELGRASKKVEEELKQAYRKLL